MAEIEDEKNELVRCMSFQLFLALATYMSSGTLQKLWVVTKKKKNWLVLRSLKKPRQNHSYSA